VAAPDSYNVRQLSASTQALNLEHWETYYRGGMLATGPAGPEGGYDLEVREAWVEFFSMLPDGARILDVGTGNGAVAKIAAETAAARGRNWEIHATDLAQIDPPRHVRDGARRLAGITFHAGVATEHLPFETQSFDAVSGHYSLEYTDIPAALTEIHRILKSPGDAQFVMHNADSVLVRSARNSLEEAALVLGATKMYRRLHRLVTMDRVAPDALQRAGDEVRAAIHILKTALNLAQQAGAGTVLSVTLDAVQKLLTARKEMKAQAVGLEVDKVERELRASVRSLNDLLIHARTEQEMEKIEIAAAAAGFSLIERMPQYHGGMNVIGWQLLLHRA
jgi:ubiquinone/menaquinone biosynthesis C-methylase UbiE